METTTTKKYHYLINEKCGLVGGRNYGSVEAAEAAIPDCNIPNKDARVFTLPHWIDNKIDYSKCTPLKFD